MGVESEHQVDERHFSSAATVVHSFFQVFIFLKVFFRRHLSKPGTTVSFLTRKSTRSTYFFYEEIPSDTFFLRKEISSDTSRSERFVWGGGSVLLQFQPVMVGILKALIRGETHLLIEDVLYSKNRIRRPRRRRQGKGSAKSLGWCCWD